MFRSRAISKRRAFNRCARSGDSLGTHLETVQILCPFTVKKELSARRPQRSSADARAYAAMCAFGLEAAMGSVAVLLSLVEAVYKIQASTSLIAIVGPKILGAPCVRAGVALQLCCCDTSSRPGTLKSRPPRPGDHRHQPNWAAPWQVSSCTRKGPQVVDFRLCVRVCG